MMTQSRWVTTTTFKKWKADRQSVNSRRTQPKFRETSKLIEREKEKSYKRYVMHHENWLNSQKTTANLTATSWSYDHK